MKALSKFHSLVVIATALLAVPVRGALPAYMQITGDNQGAIEGSVTDAGREDTILVIAFEHQIIAPRDPATGQLTGRRQHGAVKVTIPLDRCSPLLHQAMTSNERLGNVTIRFYRLNSQGLEEHYYTIELVNAAIASIRLWKPNTLDPAATHFPDMEEVQFVYQRIIWTWEDGGISSEDTVVDDRAR